MTSRTSDPTTSKDAGQRATTPAKLRASHALILNVFRAYGAMDDKALLEAVYSVERNLGVRKPMSPSGVRSRRSELVKAGRIRDTGRRDLVDGRHVIVWGLVDAS